MTSFWAWIRKVLGVRDQIVNHSPSDGEKRLDVAVKRSNINVERAMKAPHLVQSWEDLFGITERR
jgi:hypothetical protein